MFGINMCNIVVNFGGDIFLSMCMKSGIFCVLCPMHLMGYNWYYLCVLTKGKNYGKNWKK